MVSNQSVLVMNLEEGERFIMCSAALFDSRINDNAKISIKSSTMEIVHSTEVMCHKQKTLVLAEKISQLCV